MGIFLDVLLSLGVPLAVKKLKQDPYPEGSPPYEYEPSALAAGASEVITPETRFPGSRTYGALDTCIVINNDVVDLDITINGAKENYYCPAGTVTPISGNLGIRQLKVTNLDGSTALTAGSVVLRLRKAPKGIDDVARDLF